VTAPTPLRALDARDYADVARRNGIPQSAHALVLAGRLLPLRVGRRTFYAWSEVLAVMPGWAREQNAVQTSLAVVSLGGTRG
jgi:hypothetical protein